MRLSLHIMYNKRSRYSKRLLGSSLDMRHILVLGGMCVVGGTVLALQADSLVCEEMAEDGVNTSHDSKANDDNCG